jgi:hypothetical protein
MPDKLIETLLGEDPAALAENVKLATPLTASPVAGRDAVVAALNAYAEVFGATAADLRLTGDDLEGAIFTTTVEGEVAQVAMVVTHNDEGLVATIHMYGRPWPYMALVRERLAAIEPSLANAALDSEPLDGPGTSWTDEPVIPPLAEDVTLNSPVLTGEPTGKDIVGAIFVAANETFHNPKFRAVLQIEGQAGFAAVMEEIVDGKLLQLIEMFTLNEVGEVAEITVFTRPWMVTTGLRKGIHDHLDGRLGPEYWGGPEVLSAVGAGTGHA